MNSTVIDAPAPFIVGVPRSGTTLLRLMLDAHPLLAIPPETHFVPKVLRRCGEAPDVRRCCIETMTSHGRWPEFELDEADLQAGLAGEPQPDQAAVLRAFYRLYATAQGKPRWGDKTPWYMKQMRRIGAAIPEARFIHIIRDGRDVALSLREVDWGPDTIAGAAERWRDDIRKARRQARDLEGRYLEVRFEELVRAPADVLAATVPFVNLSWDDAMLAHHETSAIRFSERFRDRPEGGLRAHQRVDEHRFIDQPARADRAGRWAEEMTRSERTEFEAVAGELLAELGY